MPVIFLGLKKLYDFLMTPWIDKLNNRFLAHSAEWRTAKDSLRKTVKRFS